jgi:NAD(P)-dependent dehydrogenase (short-subunit alcohol dehydrogenase family)
VVPLALAEQPCKISTVRTSRCFVTRRYILSRLAEHGAKVVIGDVATKPGQELEDEFGASNVRFVRCNTSSYEDQLQLFAIAQKEFGRVHVVIANAAVATYMDYFTLEDDVEIGREPPFHELNINLRGVMFTARIGLHYLRKAGGGDLILVSSIGGFKETANLTPYVVAKHGVIGILRGLRLTTLRENIRVNVVCPWATGEFFPTCTAYRHTHRKTRDGYGQGNAGRMEGAKSSGQSARRRQQGHANMRIC